MSGYTGWAADFLTAAGFPNTAKNRRFLTEWSAHANAPTCVNNPIDLTARDTGARSCKPTGTAGRSYQRYTSPLWARTAFQRQTQSGDYPALVAALNSGDPYSYADHAGVAADLANWQSHKFATAFTADTATAGTSQNLKDAQALRGWHDLQRAFNKRLPAYLTASQHARNAALRELRRARKVRL